MSSASKMDSQHTSMWVNFFTAAGIPSDVGATYALTFTENRIQNDMLLDLNKEYLRDMGIVRMGDVIAILRHAKTVHENTARDRVLSSAGSSGKVPVAAVTAQLTNSPTKPSSPASRILEHYTRNTPPKEPAHLMSKVHGKRKHVADLSNDAATKKSRLIRFSSSSPPTVANSSSNKNTVFSRLGNSEAKNVTLKTSKPIYSRLGAKTESIKDRLVSEVPIEEDALKYEGILKTTVPIKKEVTVTTTKDSVRKIAMMGTMRADEKPLTAREKLAVTKAKSVKFSAHVQYNEVETQPQFRIVQSKVMTTKEVIKKPTQVFNKPERRLSMPDLPVGSGVKARLGIKSNSLVIKSESRFSRLGV